MNRPERGAAAGFSLLELLLALSLGLLLAGAALQALVAEARASQRLGLWLQARAQADRALTLLRQEAARATRLTAGGLGGGRAACGLSGRRVLLQLEGPAGPITYTLGAPPSAIWRGEVLMRCGPAYGLDGEASTGLAQNRVLLDGLEAGASRAERVSAAVLRVTLAGRGRMAVLLRAVGGSS